MLVAGRDLRPGAPVVVVSNDVALARAADRVTGAEARRAAHVELLDRLELLDQAGPNPLRSLQELNTQRPVARDGLRRRRLRGSG